MYPESHSNTVAQKPEHLSLFPNPWLLCGQEESPEVNNLRLTFALAIVLQDVYVIKYNNN